MELVPPFGDPMLATRTQRRLLIGNVTPIPFDGRPSSRRYGCDTSRVAISHRAFAIYDWPAKAVLSRNSRDWLASSHSSYDAIVRCLSAPHGRGGGVGRGLGVGALRGVGVGLGVAVAVG